MAVFPQDRLPKTQLSALVFVIFTKNAPLIFVDNARKNAYNGYKPVTIVTNVSPAIAKKGDF